MEILSSAEYKSILGYLPATIIQNVISSRIDLKKTLPQHYQTDSVGLFSDISGFTKLSEAFSKKGRYGPEFLTFCINRYMEQIINIIGANGGDIFKFVGDAIMVIWPPDGSENFIENACKRACQCAMDIQNKLSNLEIVKGIFLNVKIGIGVGQCHILFVGGLFGRCEYLCVGECMRQACESETHSSSGGQIVMSEQVQRYVYGSYNFIKAEIQPGYSKNDNLAYFMIDRNNLKTMKEKITTKADAFLMRKLFNKNKIRNKVDTLRTFIPAAVKKYLNIEKESWCKEIRLVTSMFLNIKVDLSQLKDESSFMKVQKIINTVQRCIYRTWGALNKFLMDDKGSEILIVWGIPPLSSRNDPLDCVCSAMAILSEFRKLGLECAMGLATGTCFVGVCGTVGNRREYSLLGDIVNLSSRYMSQGLSFMKENNLESILVICEKTKNLIQNKIRCRFLFSSELKGFSVKFNFFEPVSDEELFFPNINDPFPFIRTHCLNPVPFLNMGNEKKKDCLKLAFRCSGRRKEIKVFVDKMNYVYENEKKKFFMVKGDYGSGKSFFIRKCLFLFLFKNKNNGDLINSYLQNSNLEKPNYVLCSYQYPLLNKIPFNGFAFIFRQIYLYLNKYIYSEEKGKDKFIKLNKDPESIFGNIQTLYNFDNIKGDSFAEILAKNQCLEFLEILEEMLNCSREDIHLKEHFNKETYKKYILPLQPSSLFSNSKKHSFKFKKRDPFFDKYNIDNIYPLMNLFYDILKLYRNEINRINKKIKKKIPLILVIEDTEKIDSYSIQFLHHLLYDPCKDLKPLIIILSYQEQFRFLKNENDLIGHTKDFILEMSLDEFELNKDEKVVNNISMKNLTNKEEIEELIKNYILEISLYDRFDSLFKVDPTLINILIDKSFCGIPLFIRDILEQLINSKLVQNCVEELLITSELEDMEKQRNYIDLFIPLRIEKICGEMIDSIQEREIIILKHASVIGNLFDIQTLHSIIPFNFTILDLYDTLLSFEKKGIIEFLYDLDPKKKKVVCKFSCPFIREVLYQRMLIQQKSEIHMKIARLMQKNNLNYLSNKIEKIILKKHLELGEKSIVREMEQTENEEEEETKSKLSYNTNNEKIKNNNNNINLNALKIILVKEICDKLRDIKLKISDNEEIEHYIGKEKLLYTIKHGMIDKKSDGKITWESRFFVMTPKVISYYYHEEEFINGKVPLATFELKDMFNIKQLDNRSFGNRKNIFSLTVTKWIKKEIPQGKRIYILSCSNVEDLYSWLITLNFMKVNAYYDSFISHFGKIDLPLYRKNITKVKKYLFNIEDKIKIGIKTYCNTLGNNNNSNSQRGENKKDFILGEIDYFKIFKEIIHLCFLLIFGDIQEGITKKKNDSFYNELKSDHSTIEEIQNPLHISYFKNLSLDIITKDDKSKDDKKEDRKNSGFISNFSLISMESLNNNNNFGMKGRSSSNFMNLSNIQNIQERDEENFTEENEHKNTIKYIEGQVQKLKNKNHNNVKLFDKGLTGKNNNNLINETDSENEEEENKNNNNNNNNNDKNNRNNNKKDNKNNIDNNDNKNNNDNNDNKNNNDNNENKNNNDNNENKNNNDNNDNKNNNDNNDNNNETNDDNQNNENKDNNNKNINNENNDVNKKNDINNNNQNNNNNYNFDIINIPLIEDTPDLSQLNNFIQMHNNNTPISSILNTENVLEKENIFEKVVLNKLKHLDIKMDNEEQYYMNIFEKK